MNRDEQFKPVLIKLDREKFGPLNPPDEAPLRALACAVIFSVAKTYRAGDLRRNRTCTEFFLGKDYEWWAYMAGLDIDGGTILKALEKNKGVVGSLDRYVSHWSGFGLEVCE